MKVLVLFGIALILSTFIVSGVADDSSNIFIYKIVEKVNENNLYLNFISESKYNSVKLVVDDEVYYFIYENSSVKQKKEIKKPDVAIKLSSKEFNRIVRVYEEENLKELKKMVFMVLPFRVKFNVIFQCLRTDWCRAMIF